MSHTLTETLNCTTRNVVRTVLARVVSNYSRSSLEPWEASKYQNVLLESISKAGSEVLQSS
jgi:hypothetical protein